ncbi:MAG TPA: hypothetical protein VFW87_19000 [Pirellulales bacterium]|nr:hypothetical protein [Pirellulales bacterium]
MRFAVIETKAPSADMPAALEPMLSSGERLRIGPGVDAATPQLVLDAVRRRSTCPHDSFTIGPSRCAMR